MAVFDRSSPSTSRRDYPVRKTEQERPRVRTYEESSGLPSRTPVGTCGCSNCWPGTPVAEGDTFAETCGCVNRIRNAWHPELWVRFPDRDRVKWDAAGGPHQYNYQGDGIWKTRLFDGPFCDDEETLFDQYYYKLDANTLIVTLELEGDPEEANCPVIVATWCFADGCAFSCLCPWLFKRTMPFRYAESPPDCVVCITPVRRVAGRFCSITGCDLTIFMALTIPEFSFGVSSQEGCPGDMDVGMIGYPAQTSWPDEIELPACIEDIDGEEQVVSFGTMTGGSTTLMIPFQEQDSTFVHYHAWLAEGACDLSGPGVQSSVRISLECKFVGVVESVEITVAIVFWVSVVGGVVGCQTGSVGVVYQVTVPLSELCTSQVAVPFRNANWPVGGGTPPVAGDAQFPQTVYVDTYEPSPPNTSGDDASDCGGEPYEKPDCASEACVLEVQVIGEGLGKRWIQNVEDSTCEACGDCYAECNGGLDPVCGDANDYPEGYKCFQACKEEVAGSDTVSVTFDYSGSGGCACGETTAVLCLTDEGLYEGTVTLCGETFNFSYYEDGGTWHLDGGPINATSANPAGPFEVAGTSDLPGCDGLNNVTVAP